MSQNDLDISVVIPMHNAGSFIRSTLESITCQSRLPNEIIIIDDCSTDSSTDIAKDYLRELELSHRVVKRKIASGGPAVPINEGVNLANSEWIALLDHDDLMFPEKLETQIAAAEATNADVVFSDWIHIDARKKGLEKQSCSHKSGLGTERQQTLSNKATKISDEVFVIPPECVLQEQILDPGIIQSCSNLFFRKSLFEKHGPLSNEFTSIADYIFKLNIAPATKTAFVAKPLFYKREHGENLFTKSYSAQLRKTIVKFGLEAARSNAEITINDNEFLHRLNNHLKMLSYQWRKRGDLRESLWIELEKIKINGFKTHELLSIVQWPLKVARDSALRTLEQILKM